ncbi:MAG: transglycosylase SLT domain-containing protein, partial [Moraxella sp.]
MAVLSRLDIEISANSARFQQEIQNVSTTSRRAAAQLQRDQQQQAQSRLQIERQYASQERQAQIDLTDEIIRIRQARFNIADENRYTQQAIQAAQRRTAEVAAIEQNKARESAEKAATNRLQIERQYASDHRKIEIDLAHELERIRAAGFNHDDQNRLIQQARDNAQAQVDAIADQERATTNYGEKAKIAFGYVAAGAGIAAAAIGALVKEQMELVSELNSVALKANTTAEAIQKYSFAAKANGIEMDKLGDIFKDTQDKVGDFLSTGGGEMQDFFDNVAPKVGVTAEEFRKLSGPDALQLYYNSLEKANLSQNEMVFDMEAVADEASGLIPLLRKNGEGFKLWQTAAENAGAAMDTKTIRATQELKTSTELLNLSYQGVKNQIAKAFMPVLSDLAAAMVKDKTLKEQAATAGQVLAMGFKGIINVGLGVVGIFRMIGTTAGALAYAIAHPLDAINTMKQAWEDLKGIYHQTNAAMDTVLNAGTTGQTNSTVAALTDQRQAVEQLKNAYGETGKQIQDNKKAAEEAAKAASSGKYAPIPVNSTVLAHASRYGYSELEKRYGLPAGLLSAISMQESRGNPNATSYVGAKGEFQFMPATARRFGIAGQERNTAVASEAAAKYLSQHLRMFGDLDKAIAAYNAGEGNVQKVKWDTIMSNRFAKGQTFGYVKNVRGYLSFMNGGKAIDGGYDIASAMANEAQNQQKLEEQKLALQAKYSVESERRAAEHAKNVAEIEKTYTNPNDPERKRLLDQEAADYAHDVNEYELAQAKKVAAFTDFKKSERELVIQNANFEARAAANDSKATLEQKILAMDSIAEQRDLKLKAIDLQEAKERQAANAGHQTAIENIKAEAQLQRDELALNITMDT